MERASRVEPVGAALSLWSNACAAMANLGVLPEVEAAGERMSKHIVRAGDVAGLMERFALLRVRTPVIKGAIHRTVAPD